MEIHAATDSVVIHAHNFIPKLGIFSKRILAGNALNCVDTVQ
jgi:hypothetical protein